METSIFGEDGELSSARGSFRNSAFDLSSFSLSDSTPTLRILPQHVTFTETSKTLASVVPAGSSAPDRHRPPISSSGAEILFQSEPPDFYHPPIEANNRGVFSGNQTTVILILLRKHEPAAARRWIRERVRDRRSSPINGNHLDDLRSVSRGKHRGLSRRSSGFGVGPIPPWIAIRSRRNKRQRGKETHKRGSRGREGPREKSEKRIQGRRKAERGRGRGWTDRRHSRLSSRGRGDVLTCERRRSSESGTNDDEDDDGQRAQ